MGISKIGCSRIFATSYVTPGVPEKMAKLHVLNQSQLLIKILWANDEKHAVSEDKQIIYGGASKKKLERTIMLP